MKKRALLFALFYLSYLNYNQRTSTVHQPISTAPVAFHVPRVIHESIPKKYEFIYHEYLNPGNSIYLGKYKWGESLRIPNDIWKNEDNPSDIVYDFIWQGKNDNFKTDGFHLVPDYKSTIFYSDEDVNSKEGEITWTYFPLYLVNETNETRYFIFKYRQVSAIQEAEDPFAVHRDEWWPVEYDNQDVTVDGLRAIKVYPGEFVLFIMPKYLGSFEARMRVRLQNGDNTILSDPFKGNIADHQFISSPESPLHAVIKQNNINLIYSMFLGAIPKETYPGRS